jgi:hypothetical protein
MSQSLKWRTLLSVVGAAIMSLALLASTASATEPAEGYERFAGCPSPEENENITSCQLAKITGGYFNMGNKEVPIENEIQLSGGTNKSGGEFSYTSSGGMTKAPQKVPGGVIGLTGLTWLLEFFGSEALTLYATTELAGTPSSLLANPTFLPIKVHLTNPAGLLGNQCYIGSDSEPIELHLLTVAFPKFHFGEPPTVQVFENATKLDNTFSAPGANGCKLYLFGFIPISINGLVNEFSGLPAESGNETVQTVTLELVASKFVYP